MRKIKRKLISGEQDMSSRLIVRLGVIVIPEVVMDSTLPLGSHDPP